MVDLSRFRKLEPELEPVLELWIEAEPKPIQSVRFASRGGFVQAFQPKANKEWKAYIKAAVQQQLPPGWVPLTGVPVSTKVVYVYKPLKSFYKWQKELVDEGGVIWKHTKPDVNDNLNKGLYDALTGVVWQDDAILAHGEPMKIYANSPGIYMEVRTIKQKGKNK